MTVHSLKIWPEHFAPVQADLKRVEIRRNDRDYREGDMLELREYDRERAQYTGRKAMREVTHVLCELPYVPDGYVVLSVRDPQSDGVKEEATAAGMRKVLEFYAERDNWGFGNPCEMRFEEPWKAAAFAISTTAGERAARRLDALVELYRIAQEIVKVATIDNGNNKFEYVPVDLMDELRIQAVELERLERNNSQS